MNSILINSTSFLVIVALHTAPTFAAKAENGDKATKSLTDLSCGTLEVVRFNGNNWVCDAGLSTLEDFGLDTRVNTLESQNLDARINTIEGYTLDGRVQILENQNLDSRVTITELQGEDFGDRLSTIESQSIDSRLSTIESQDLSNRTDNIEAFIFAETPMTGANLAGKSIPSTAHSELFLDNQSALGMNFAGANLTGGGFLRFVSSDVRGTNFSGISGAGTWDFFGTDLRGSNFQGATAKIRLIASNLSGVSFFGATPAGIQGLTIGGNSSGIVGKMEHLDLRNTIVTCPLIGGNPLDFSDFSGSTWTCNGSVSTHFIAQYCYECAFNDVDFSGWKAFGSNKEIQISDGQYSAWRRANLENIHIRGVVFNNADFRHANLSGATLEDMNLTNAEFSNANLSGVTWINVTCPDGTASDDNGGTCEFNLID